MFRARSGCLLAGVLSLCGLVHAEESTRPPRQMEPPTRIPDPVVAQKPGERVDIATVPRAVRRAVVEDAARRFSVSENEVVLVNAERVTWSDGSMGCPDPGQMYTQMLVPGFRIAAKTGAGQMLYHTDSRGTVVTCADSRIQVGPKILSGDHAGKGAEPRKQTLPPAKSDL